MSDVAIRVENLGKLYRIGREERYRTLRDTLVEGAQGAVRAVRRLFSRDGRRTESPPTIWALKDVSFEVKRGEVLGIIGRNGAGKTTLLKILSRVTEPTEGYAEIRGRVGSLLEVGTGFHPELTGRENIYLYGAILGMKKAEIQRKFDEIVGFAEVEKFIDTPVKHYSSGMYLRLAFAVAAHLEPEILLVDEVLAVGDAQFQKKCLGKMGDVAGEGRTVLFVSHNLAAISNLASSTLWLESGTAVSLSGTHQVITAYLSSVTANDALAPDKPRISTPGLQTAKIIDHDTGATSVIHFGRRFSVVSEWVIGDWAPPLDFLCRIQSSDGTIVATCKSSDADSLLDSVCSGQHVTVTWSPLINPLLPGVYFVDLEVWSAGCPASTHFRSITFRVAPTHAPSRLGIRRSYWAGVVFLPSHWTITCAPPW